MQPRAVVLMTVSLCLLLSGPDSHAKRKHKAHRAKPAAVQAPAQSAEEVIEPPSEPSAQQPKGEAPSRPPAATPGTPESPSMKKALKLYEAADYYSSSIELSNVVEGQTQDSEATRQRAEFWMGKTLYNLGFYSAALSYFGRVADKGPSHAYYHATLKWLASLTHKLPDSVGILEKIGKYDRQQLDQPALEPVRDELYYLMGRYYYGKGNFKEAISLFSAVPEKSEYFLHAKFLEGTSYVRSYQARPAAESFKVLLRAARERSRTKEIVRHEELANLSLARIFYGTGQYDLSIKYYDKIPRESPRWLPALFESSWAHFMRSNFSKALGNIHSLNSPYFEDYYFPESLVLKAVIYWKNCLYEDAGVAVRAFNATYPALRRDVDEVLAKNLDALQMYDYAVKVRKSQMSLPQNLGRLLRAALADRSLKTAFTYVDELDRELKKVETADAAWRGTGVAATILQDLTLQKSLAMNTGGDLARSRLKRISDEIRELQKQAIKVEYEVINGQRNTLEASLRNEQVLRSPKTGPAEIKVDDEHSTWPFEGEYWRDELGSYRFKIASQCTR